LRCKTLNLREEDPKDYVDLFFLLPCLELSAKDAVELGLQKEGGLDSLILADQIQLIQNVSPPDDLLTDVPWENIRHFFRTFREDVLDLIAPW